MADAANNNSGRDPRGRFAPGNSGGPGGSRRRAFELRRAAQESVTPEMTEAIIRKAVRMALEGNLQAMRFVYENMVGRPAEVPAEGEPLSIALPQMRTAEDCAVAIDKVTQAFVRGDVNHATAQLLSELISSRLKAIEGTEHERHLAELERQAKAFESKNPYQT